MKRVSSNPLVFASLLTGALVGCNTILDNHAAVLLETAEAGTVPTPSVAAPAPAEAAAVQGTDGGSDAADTQPPACPTGQQMCFGTCVSLTDPVYGCGAPTCAPCPSTHSTMGCQGRACVVTACDPGYSDCNAQSADGCEVDLSKATTCGACNAVCPAAAPLCAPSGPSFQCTNGCTPGAPVNCGEECVDPLTSEDNCGGCNIKCPVVANAATACNAGACATTCKMQFHACAGKCVARTDPATCGAACTPCVAPTGGMATCLNDTCGMKCGHPAHLCGAKCVGVGPADNDPLACGAACKLCAIPPNGVATCGSGTCGITCSAGFGNCDANAANGCESTFASDPLNCGVCGKSCAGQACVNGVCNVAPPPP